MSEPSFVLILTIIDAYTYTVNTYFYDSVTANWSRFNWMVFAFYSLSFTPPTNIHIITDKCACAWVCKRMTVCVRVHVNGQSTRWSTDICVLLINFWHRINISLSWISLVLFARDALCMCQFYAYCSFRRRFYSFISQIKSWHWILIYKPEVNIATFFP